MRPITPVTSEIDNLKTNNKARQFKWTNRNSCSKNHLNQRQLSNKRAALKSVSSFRRYDATDKHTGITENL